MNGPVVVTIVSVIGTVIAAWLAYQGRKTEVRSQAKTTEVSVGASSLAEAVEAWKAIAEDAKSTAVAARTEAAEALRRSAAAEYEARAAREQNERLEMDILSLVGYLRAMWSGFVNGTVPPHLPIPERLRHILSDSDFPSPH